MVEVAPGTIVVFSDIGCPWAHVAVWRLHDARRRLGLDGRRRRLNQLLHIARVEA